jgi:hypothetical protein
MMPETRVEQFGLDHCLVQTVGADSISARTGQIWNLPPTQYVAERMIRANNSMFGANMSWRLFQRETENGHFLF